MTPIEHDQLVEARDPSRPLRRSTFGSRVAKACASIVGAGSFSIAGRRMPRHAR